MAFFIGFAISSLFVPSLSDRHGRKRIFVVCMLTNLFVLIGIFIMPSKSNYIWAVIALFLFQGLEAGGLTAIGYCYFVELAPKWCAEYLGTIWNVSEGCNFIFLTIYYAYISKDWRHTFIFAIAI